MKTAAEVLKEKCDADRFMCLELAVGYIDGDTAPVLKAMVEFAKLHVVEALKQASEKATTRTQYASDGYESWDYQVPDEHSILNAYSLENIKSEPETI